MNGAAKTPDGTGKSGPGPIAEPLKVLHIDLEKGWRGGEQQAAYLISHLRELGVESLLAARSGEAMSRWAREADLVVLPVGSWLWAGFRLAPRVRRAGVRIVHAHSSRSHNLGLLLRILLPGVRLVVSRRVDFHRRPGWINRWKYASSLVEFWVAISEKVREVLIADGVPERRIAVIHSGIDVARIEAAKPAGPRRKVLRAELGLRPDEFLIGSVGALVPHKDRETLIRALGFARQSGLQARLVIAGAGEERPGLEALIDRLGLSAAVQLLGERSDVPELLHLFDLFVLSSRQEGLGTSVLDAMAAGLPVIVTDAGGMPEMVQNGRNGIVVPPENPGALAEALTAMVQNKTLRESAARNNPADVLRFSARNTAEKTLSLYRKLLEAG